MTTYVFGSEIYAKVLREKLELLPDIAYALAEIHELRRSAKRVRKEALEPGFQPPHVSYIPAYGVEDQVRALVDYCRLKKLLDRSESLANFVAASLLSPSRRRCEVTERRALLGEI